MGVVGEEGIIHGEADIGPSLYHGVHVIEIEGLENLKKAVLKAVTGGDTQGQHEAGYAYAFRHLQRFSISP